MVEAFDAEQWVLRMGKELERVASDADPCFFPQNAPAPRGATEEQIREHEKRQYRDLACAATHDETAAKLFAKSSLRLKADPQDARSALREHPFLRPGLTDCGGTEAVGFLVLIRWFSVTLDWLIANLAKVAVRDGGESAARCFHNFLVAADGAGVPGYEIIVIHGLDLDRRFELGHGAFLAPYRSVRKRFDLPEEDSAWFEFDRPESRREASAVAAAAFVRRMRYRPGIHPGMLGEGWPEQVVSFEFPDAYEVSSEDWPSDSRMLADLLSVSLGVPLLCRCCFFRLDEWVAQLDPNIAYGASSGDRHPSAIWPKGHPIDARELDAFARMAKGWVKYRREHGAIDLGVRRLAGSYSRAVSRFGVEDIIVDVAITLEAMYGSSSGHTIAQRAAGLLEGNDESRLAMYDTVKRFHEIRSEIVHADESPPSREEMETSLEAARDVGRRTLQSLCDHGSKVAWAGVTKAIDGVRHRLGLEPLSRSRTQCPVGTEA